MPSFLLTHFSLLIILWYQTFPFPLHELQASHCWCVTEGFQYTCIDDDLVFCRINGKEKVENRNCCKNTSKINLGPRKNGMTTTCIQQQKFKLCEPTTLKLPYAPSTLTELFRDRKTRLLLTGYSRMQKWSLIPYSRRFKEY